jgi:2-iminobutanoate/2-iminopropanoate deaminase
MNKPVNPSGFPVHPFYSQAVESTAAGRMLFVAGQVGVGQDGGLPSDIAAQTRNALGNLTAVLAAGDMSPSDVVKFTIYLTDAANMDVFAATASETLPQPPPAATLVIVKGLASPQMLVEIEAIAMR